MPMLVCFRLGMVAIASHVVDGTARHVFVLASDRGLQHSGRRRGGDEWSEAVYIRMGHSCADHSVSSRLGWIMCMCESIVIWRFVDFILVGAGKQCISIHPDSRRAALGSYDAVRSAARDQGDRQAQTHRIGGIYWQKHAAARLDRHQQVTGARPKQCRQVMGEQRLQPPSQFLELPGQASIRANHGTAPGLTRALSTFWLKRAFISFGESWRDRPLSMIQFFSP